MARLLLLIINMILCNRLLSLTRTILSGACLLCYCTASAAEGQRMSADTCLKELSSLQEQNSQQLQEVDQRLKNLLNKALKESSRTQEIHNEVTALQKKRKEYLLRQKFLDRLQFYVDTHYRGGPWKDFFQKSLQRMTDIEVKSLNSSDSLWKFMSSLAVALEHAPNDSNRLISFIEGYISNSSIMNPISPESFQEKLDYTNDREGYSARGVSQENLGEIVEQRKEKLKTLTIKAPLLRSATISD